MTPRHIALAVGAFVVFATGVYLFVEVRSAPAQTQIASRPTPPPTTPPVVETGKTTTEPPKLAPSPPPVAPAPPPTPTATPDDAAVADTGPPNKLHPPGFGPFHQRMDAAAVKLEPMMNAASKAYDKGEYDEARQIAAKILAAAPGNERMLRIMVSSSCIEGDSVDAQKYFNMLPARDRGAMKTRCERYGVNFADPPTQ